MRPFEELMAGSWRGSCVPGVPVRGVHLTVRELVVVRLGARAAGRPRGERGGGGGGARGVPAGAELDAPEEMVETVCRAALEAVRGHGGESARWLPEATSAAHAVLDRARARATARSWRGASSPGGSRAGRSGLIETEHRTTRRTHMNGRVDARCWQLLAKNWWVVALRGVAAILFGVLAAIVPGLTLAALVMLFGALRPDRGRLQHHRRPSGGAAGDRPWWALLLEGLVSIAAGVIAFVMPGLTALALVYLIAAWAILTGVLEIAAAVRLRKHITGEWWLALTGVLSIAFGVLVSLFRAPGPWSWSSGSAPTRSSFGVLLLVVAFKLRTRATARLEDGDGGARHMKLTVNARSTIEGGSHGYCRDSMAVLHVFCDPAGDPARSCWRRVGCACCAASSARGRAARSRSCIARRR